ncbi:MurR/RpiR family transcriptional regulator [Actinophytocola gossypii]|uniref:MurR/RpiR family transcriptional regulator n=1 Tax=Actinophytocola gossypii TaxID=2812003 RepID=A0ABT2JAK2_9PSEU|nr:MurR/RpiR family transcriptional regulator [Actinophytocola gossypii]MCT2584485.1 MurR/RpiR family transcriptional regulator [Actinophytocola gossypii]
MEATDAPLHERVAALAGGMSASERMVAEYMADHPEIVVACSASELGTRTGTSDATVVRATKALGYTGYRELKRTILGTLTRQRDLAATMDDRLARAATEDGPVGRVLDDTVALLGQLRRGLDMVAWRRAVDALIGAPEVMTYGIGPAGVVASYLCLSLKRIGLRARGVETTGFRLADELLALRRDEVVVVFAPIREFREISLVVGHAERVGAKVVVVTESLGMALADRVHAVLSTPQSTTSTASEITAGLVLAHALTLSVAVTNRSAAVDTLRLVNELRASASGAELDMSPLPPLD